MMKLINQIIFTLLFLCSTALTQAAPVCDPDPNTVKLIKEMIANARLAEVIKSNGALAQYWRTIGAEDLIKAWNVVESDKNLRQDPDIIKKLHLFIKSENLSDEEIKNLKKSFNSQKTEDDRKKWVALKHTKADLETKYASMSQNPPPKLTPWTKEHKAQRWNNYKESGGTKDYAKWSNIYDGNINKSKKADEAAKEYAAQLPGAKREITSTNSYKVQLTHNGRNEEVTGKRRHDILVGQNAYEVKDYRSSKVNLSADIEREVLMDVAMRDKGDIKTITWVFTKHPDGKGRPSQPLLDLLNKHNIKVEYRNP